MALNLERKDYLLIVGGTILVLAAAFVNQRFTLGNTYVIGDAITTIAGISTVYFIYRSQDVLGGEVGRYALIIGLGIGFYSITLMPHVISHENMILSGLVGKNMAISVYIAQHILVLWSFLLIAYGFYLFWKGGSR